MTAEILTCNRWKQKRKSSNVKQTDQEMKNRREKVRKQDTNLTCACFHFPGRTLEGEEGGGSVTREVEWIPEI